MIACPFLGRGGLAAVLMVPSAAGARDDVATPDVREGWEEAGRVRITSES